MSTDRAAIDRVRRVGMRIVEATGPTDLDWEFTVIEDDETINAWALPGGKVAVYTGLLDLTEGDDGLLATVLGHEIAHVTERHGAARISQQLGVAGAASLLVLALQNREAETVNLVMGAFGIGTQVFMALPFGRAQESESDRLGLRYMARAGYDPARAIVFWKRMAAQTSSGSVPEFLSTHPSHETRIHDLDAWQEEARTYAPQ
jgi:predicted Zn-dependent protease